jgi:hypothetical protein
VSKNKTDNKHAENHGDHEEQPTYYEFPQSHSSNHLSQIRDRSATFRSLETTMYLSVMLYCVEAKAASSYVLLSSSQQLQSSSARQSYLVLLFLLS